MPEATAHFIPPINPELATLIPPNMKGGVIETVSPEKKQELFSEAVNAMRGIASERHIRFPDNILDRLHIVDEYSFLKLYQGGTGGEMPPDMESSTGIFTTFAITTPDGKSILRQEAIEWLAKRERLSVESVMQAIGIHELWHSLTVQSAWVRKDGDGPPSYGPDNPLRMMRSGLFLSVDQIVENAQRFLMVFFY